MMQQMRRNTKWIMILVAMAFGGLMFFEWGMDITGQTAGSFGEIGRVNGTPVTYEQYMATYRNLYDQRQAVQEEPITNVQNSELEDQAWEELVNTILVRQELDRRGIVVTDREIVQAARSSPPPELMSHPAFLTDDQFDIGKYQQYIATADNATLLDLEAYYRNIIPRGKLLRQISSGVYVPDGKLWGSYQDENEKASVRYVSFDPLTRVSDDQIEISDDEVSSHYVENRENYAVPATAGIIVVAVLKTPSPEDSAAVLTRADEVRQAILDGEDFATLAERESADEVTAVEGGDLGVFAQGRMVAAFDSAVFAAGLNRVTEPVRTDFGLHLIEVSERWGQDSARARHILLPFERTEESEIALLETADSLEVLGEAMTLAQAATNLGLEADTLEIFESSPFVPLAGLVEEGGEWAFDPETSFGDVSPVFENRSSFYALELVSFDAGGYMTEEEAAARIRAEISVEKKLAAARQEALTFVEDVRDSGSLAETARSYALELRDTGPFSRTEFVPGLGISNAVIGTAFGLDIGEVSDAVEANSNVYVLEMTGSEAADSLAWQEQAEQQRSAVVNAIRQQRLAQWIEALRETANVVDRREEVLTVSEEDPVPGFPAPF